MSKRVMIYKPFERFWHWSQMLLIVFMGLTGFEIHGTFTLFGFEQAVRWHNLASWALIILIAFAIFWHFVTGEWRQYVPKGEKVSVMIRYYTSGIFKNEPHPYKKTELSKLNPLQRLTYLGFKLLIVPVMVTTGLIMMFDEELGLSFAGMAWWHTLGAFLLVTFFIVHVYMTTTGKTVFSNIKAMIVGWEDLED
ncbi:MAG: cytochrome B [Anaerolineae bacterium]|nr:MAG: cytochrome B [Anaerolineae bacterium]